MTSILYRLADDFQSALGRAEDAVSSGSNDLYSLLMRHDTILTALEDGEDVNDDIIERIKDKAETLFRDTVDAAVDAADDFAVDHDMVEDDIEEQFEGVIRANNFDSFADQVMFQYY